ncbi:MAG: hypothetical protein AAGF74_09505 [Pseudomonadota bacterium]
MLSFYRCFAPLALVVLAACSGAPLVTHSPGPDLDVSTANTPGPTCAANQSDPGAILNCAALDAGSISPVLLRSAQISAARDVARTTFGADAVLAENLVTAEGKPRFESPTGDIPVIYSQPVEATPFPDNYPPAGLYQFAALRPSEAGFDVVPPSKLPADWQAQLTEMAYLRLLDATNFSEDRLLGFFDPGSRRDHESGIYMVEPYDPDRIPVLMIHGLRSSPKVWIPLTRQIMRDPVLNSRFQIWHAFYPTGLPVYYSTARIRGALWNLRSEADPAGIHIASQRMAVVGHSMGGVITRHLITEDNGALWNATFRVPPEDLPVDAVRRANYELIFDARQEPQIEFAAMVNSPHRGSNVAVGLVGRMGSRLIALPGEFTSLFASDSLPIEYVQPVMQPYINGTGPDSVRVLSPTHPLMRISAELPVPQDIDTVSIIGVKGGPACLQTPGCFPTDGVVPYWSARLEGAGKEVIIDSHHRGFDHSTTMAEVIAGLNRMIGRQ